MNVKQGFFLFSLGLVLSVPIAAQYDPFAVKMEYQSYSYKFLDIYMDIIFIFFYIICLCVVSFQRMMKMGYRWQFRRVVAENV